MVLLLLFIRIWKDIGFHMVVTLIILNVCVGQSPQGRPPGAKDVTYDERGNIVGVMKINPQKLPSHR